MTPLNSIRSCLQPVNPIQPQSQSVNSNQEIDLSLRINAISLIFLVVCTTVVYKNPAPFKN